MCEEIQEASTIAVKSNGLHLGRLNEKFLHRPSNHCYALSHPPHNDDLGGCLHNPRRQTMKLLAASTKKDCQG